MASPHGLERRSSGQVRDSWSSQNEKVLLESARATESDSLLTRGLGDSGTNLRTPKSLTRHDSWAPDSDGSENIGPLIDQAFSSTWKSLTPIDVGSGAS